MYPIRSRARTDLLKPPQTVVCLVTQLSSVEKHRGAAAANLRAERSRSRTPRNARRYSEKSPVVQHQFAPGGADGWFGGADSECRSSSAISRDGRDGGPFPALRPV